jgi:D-alanyl-D-alanine carboxypeptidase (penicillin-binding protein 5/6)
MKKLKALFIAALSFLAIISIFPSMTNAAPSPKHAPMIIPPAPDVNAEAFVLMDAATGQVLAQKNMDQRRQPASLTKLMTLYLTFQALAQGQIKIDDKVRIGQDAWSTGGSRMFLKLGSEVSVNDLIQGIIIASGNDACVALADYIAGNQSSFSALMNMTAKRLGMKNSNFVDATGLPAPDHYMTAYDLALLARAIATEFPQYYRFFGEKWVTWNNIKQPNRNRLLWRDPSVDGLKTGHTQEAGYCLIASAKRLNMRLVSVVLGAPTDSERSNDSQALLNWGFRFYKSYVLYKADTTVTNARVYMAQSGTVSLGVDKDFTVTLPIGQYDNLKAAMEVDPKLRAPIEKGKTYGNINVTLDGKPVGSAPLVALESDNGGGFFSRIKDRFLMLFKG